MRCRDSYDGPAAASASMATVAVTAVVSARTHHANGNVDWARVYTVLPAVVIGVLNVVDVMSFTNPE